MEEERRKEMHGRERERRREWRREKDAAEAKKLVRKDERRERKEKQKMLEDRWKLLRWLAHFTELNTDKWESSSTEERKRPTSDEWNSMDEIEKRNLLREQSRNHHESEPKAGVREE